MQGCRVPCSLSSGQGGAGVGLPGLSANASPASPPSCFEFPFSRIIPAATRSSYNKLGVSALSQC